MKAATALKLHKFADATVFNAHCQFMVDKALRAVVANTGYRLVELDQAILDFEQSLENLKVSKAGLFAALEVEDLTL